MNRRYRVLVASLGLALLQAPSVAADVYSSSAPAIARAVGDRFLGMHVLYLVPRGQDRRGVATPWPAAPVGSLRLLDSGVRWADIQPQRGRWQFERMDAYVRLAEQRGAEVVYVLGSTPQWASARPTEKCPFGHGCAAEPADMSDWETYVRTVVRRYKGRIGVYELANEPKFYTTPDKFPGGFFSGSVEAMVEMGRILRKVLNEEDPNARLASPGFDGGPRWVEMFLAAGGKSFIDVLSYHFYSQDAKGFAEQLTAIRAVMTRQGIAALPLWNTESGFELEVPGARSLPFKKSSPHMQAALYAQTMVLAAAGGVERFYAYAWDHKTMGMVDEDNMSLPSATAIARSAEWLRSSVMEGCRANGQLVTCDGRRGDQLFTVLWSADGRPIALDASQARRVLTREAAFGDGSATEVGSMPMLVRWKKEPTR